MPYRWGHEDVFSIENIIQINSASVQFDFRILTLKVATRLPPVHLRMAEVLK
jgi:hypothetical protein